MSTEKVHKNIASLVRLLIILAFFSAVAIIALAGFGMYRIHTHQIIKLAEREAVVISHLLVDHNQQLLFSENTTAAQLQVQPKDIDFLNQSLVEFLDPLDIVKIKIFSLDGTVIYSTDNAIIGEIGQQNDRLEAALGGANDSHIEFKEEVRDLKDETTFDVDVVETYTPIMLNGHILGAFELYMDVTKFREEIRNGTLQSLLLLSTILLIVYIIAFSVARIGMKQVAESEERLRDQAMIDSLTGIFNRGELMSRAEEEMARVTRHTPDGSSGELSLVMLDIDHFKRVNDSFGHQAGDTILQQMSDRIKEGLRLYDIIGRYGGEEFLLLLPQTNLAGACRVAERIRCSVAEKPFKFKQQLLNVTISLGISSFTPGVTLAEAINQADQALYKAKQNGRNRIEHHAPLGTELDN